MTEVLLSPKAFFERLAGRQPRIWAAFGVFFLALLAGSAASQLANRNLPAMVRFGNPWVWVVVGAFFGGLIVWGVVGALVMLLSGTGARAFEVVGWSGAAVLVVGLVTLVIAALYPIQGVIPPAPADPAQLPEWMNHYQEVIKTSTYGQLSRWLSLLGMFWSTWIVYNGVLDFNRARAALTAGVLLALGLALFFIGSVRLGL